MNENPDGYQLERPDPTEWTGRLTVDFNVQIRITLGSPAT